jgi:hypothetical protein
MDNEYRSPAEVWQVLSPTRQTESPGWVSGEPAEEAEVVSVEEAEILDAVLEFGNAHQISFGAVIQPE